MIMILALLTLVALLKGAYTHVRFVTTTIYVRPIPAMLALDIATMSQQIVMITINVPLKNVNYLLVNVYIPLLTAMITAHAPSIVVLLIMAVLIMQFYALLHLVRLENVM
jgi:hypothetical protein